MSKYMSYFLSYVLCPLCQILFRQTSYVAALRLLDKAASLSHANPIPLFHKAKVLESLGQYEVGGAYS